LKLNQLASVEFLTASREHLQADIKKTFKAT